MRNRLSARVLASTATPCPAWLIL